MEQIGTAETTRSIFRNVAYGVSTWIIPMILSFFATRVIVKSLGEKDYGTYALVFGFVAYSFNFSFGRAITKYVAEYRANGETHKIKDVISATFLINTAVGLLGVSIILLISKRLVIDVFQIEEMNQDKTVLALRIAAGIVFFLMLNQIFNAVLQGIHRFDVYSNIFNVNTIAVLAGNIYLAANGYGVVGLFVWNLTVTVLTCAAAAAAAKRLLPEFGISWKIKPEIIKLVLTYSGGIIGYQFLGNVLLLFERGWITRRLGAENLTYYVVPMTLALYIHIFISSIVIVIFPLVSELENNPDKLLRLYLKASKIVVFFVFFMAVSIIVQSRSFLTLWLGAEFAEKSWFLLIVQTITFSLLAIQTVSWQLTEGLGFPAYNLKITVISFVINVLVILSLTDGYGNTGIAFGRFAGFGAMFLSVFYVEKWIFKKVQTGFWLKTGGTLAAAALMSAVVQIGFKIYFPLSWLTLAAAAASGGLIYGLVLWILKFVSEEEKTLIKNLLKG